MWDAFKCYITGICIEYSARKKKERNREKNKLLADIDRIKLQLSHQASVTDNSLLTQLEELEDKLKKNYDYETKGLIIRSRVRWLEDGEKNSKYFCNLENRTWQKKNISKIQDPEGNMITDPSSILKEIQEFYGKLYSSQDADQATLDGNNVNEALFDKLDIAKLAEDDKLFFGESFIKRSKKYLMLLNL